MIPAWPESDQKREWPDGPIKDYLHHLQRPDNDKHPERDKYSRTCCDAGDTVKTKFKIEPPTPRIPKTAGTRGSTRNGAKTNLRRVE
jgi:hypothetical protein